MKFKIHSKYKPTGDQPQAIDAIVNSVNNGNRETTLLGVTGSGKTFTMANVIERTQRPTLVLAHNKTLAAQLLQRVQGDIPRERGGVFCQLLRLLSAGGVCRPDRYLY